MNNLEDGKNVYGGNDLDDFVDDYLHRIGLSNVSPATRAAITKRFADQELALVQPLIDEIESGNVEEISDAEFNARIEKRVGEYIGEYEQIKKETGSDIESDTKMGAVYGDHIYGAPKITGNVLGTTTPEIPEDILSGMLENTPPELRPTKENK
jgi:hypothetical protein